MKCPKCRKELIISMKESRGMGNQSIKRCPACGTVVLVSGELITQVLWEPEEVPV